MKFNVFGVGVSSANWFTSDLHLGHERIVELCNRPFNTVEEMNETIIERWNEVVEPLDKVYVLGDVALGKISETLPLCQRLNGTKYLVPGNHDRCWSGNKRVREIDVLRYEDAGFVILENEVQFKDWKLCHFPTGGDSHTDDRFPEFRPVLRADDWLIHGHVHNLWKVNGHQINVGVDVWDFTPVSEHAIIGLIGAWDTRSD